MANEDYQDFLRELKLRTNLVDTIAHYVPITKKGGRYFCVCPFHADKNPSMAINEQDGYFHCFACQATGDAIKFIMDIESIDFNEAIKILAEKANIPVPEFKKDPQAEKKKEKADILKSIMLEAAKFYRSNLVDEEKGKEARDYLLSRGIDKETMKRYGLGVSLDYETLPKYLRYKGYKWSDIKEVGLIASEDKPSDMFANRIIVPIIDSMSNVVAFGGRVYHGEDKDGAAKYKNSTNTPLFNKSYLVYGINFIKKDRKTTGPLQDIILVEGYMDVIALGSAGIKNVVAGMGTALAEGQAREIKKICSTIYVCYDGDSAGKKATLKNIDILNDVGFDVRVMSLDNGEDPDETIKNHGVDYYLQKKKEALSIIEYKLKLCELAFDLKSVDGKAKYVQNATKVLRKVMNDETLLEVYAKVVSKLSGVSLEAIKRTVFSGKIDKLEDETKQKPLSQNNDNAKNARAARFILNRIMINAPYAEKKDINSDWLILKEHKELLTYALSLPAGEEFNVGIMYNKIEQNQEITSILDINMQFKNYENEKEYYFGCLQTIANDYISNRIDELSDQLKKCQDNNEKRNIQIEIQSLKKKKFSKEITDKI